MRLRLLDYEPLAAFLLAGDLREIPVDSRPTPRQLAMLNALGCLVVCEPGSAEPLDRRHAAGAISAALRITDEAA